MYFRGFREIPSQFSDKSCDSDSRTMKIRVKVVCTFLTLSKKPPPPLFQILATRLYATIRFFICATFDGFISSPPIIFTDARHCKQSVARSLIDRANALCSTTKNRQDEIKHVKDTLKLNLYPNTTLIKKPSNRTEQQFKGFAIIPY